MTVSSCGHDERGKYSGGAAGDQTGGEYKIRPWYSYPWDVVLRHPDQKVCADIAKLAKQAAENDCIGYDQSQRTTFWAELKNATSYLPKNIKANCEADCSSSTAAIVKAVGYRQKDSKLQGVSIDCWTGNLKQALKNAGFKVLTASKYTGSASYLMAGDILLNEEHHVVVNLTKGAKAGTDTADDATEASYKVVANSGLNFRRGPSTTYSVTRTLGYGSVVKVEAISNGWARTAAGDYCMSQYLVRA